MNPACPHCGAPASADALACPACGRLVHERELEELQERAREFERAGKTAEAIAAWDRILAFLPPVARQRDAVRAERDRLRELPSAVEPGRTGAKGRTAAAAGTMGAVGLLLLKALGKLKFLLMGLTKLKTILSMLAMAGVYTSFYGWTFGVGIVLLIYLHEMGHVMALRQRGLDFGWPVFIPFVGAFVRMKAHPRSAAEEAYIGYAGPFLGSLAAGACWLLGRAVDSPQVLVVAFFGFYINFFNLIAIPPLDGGRVVRAFSKGGWLLALAALWGCVWLHGDGLVLLIALIGTGRGLLALAERGPRPTYYQTSAGKAWLAALAYAGLAVALVAAMKFTLPPRLDVG